MNKILATIGVTRVIGIVLIAMGIIGLSTAAAISTMSHTIDNGSVAAISFFFVMMGLAMYFPSMLQGGGQNLSTMRVVVFMIISIFTIIAIKTGWNAESLADFKIDQSWVYVLGLTFGGKVVQSFSEKMGGAANIAVQQMQPQQQQLQQNMQSTPPAQQAPPSVPAPAVPGLSIQPPVEDEVTPVG